MARKMGISEILQQGYKLIFKLWENMKFDQNMMAQLISVYGGKLMINGGNEPYIRLTVNKDDPLITIEKFLQTALNERKLS